MATLDPPKAMLLPTEIIQQVYSLLAPVDFNAARHTCRSWFHAAYLRSILVSMLRRGGWQNSMFRILPPITIIEPANLNHEKVMSKWISRECSLSDVTHRSFVQVGHVDFSELIPGSRPGSLRGGVAFTVSLCGRFLLASRDNYVYIYELNHTCQQERSRWSVPLRRRDGLPHGALRPVTIIICPRTVISCSMDTSAGRNAVGFLMEGRSGMVCEIMTERLGPAVNPVSHTSWTESWPDSGSSSTGGQPGSPCVCVCRRCPVTQAPPIEAGSRSLYRSICHEDDPPRAIALCPQRNCVAFGSSSGIKLHWVDALTGQDLSRWFPLTSPSDFLYFLPARRTVDTAKKLRLISSAAAWGGPLDSLERIVQGFNTSLADSQTTSIVSFLAHNTGEPSTRNIHPFTETYDQIPLTIGSRQFGRDGFVHGVSAFSADHYRAVPLSDGYHILFTDPRSGNLCLGTDAPIGALTRLLRKVWFSPPPEAASPIPMLYAVGSDVRHGVRIVATFAASPPDEGISLDINSQHHPELDPLVTDSQVVVFYSIPPDMFQEISRIGLPSHLRNQRNPAGEWFSEWASWRLEEGYQEVGNVGDRFDDSSVFPLEVRGQMVATCQNLVEVAIDSSPDMVIWGFSAEGWAAAWAMNTGSDAPMTRSAVQIDGSIRYMDSEGDLVIGDADVPSSPTLVMEDVPTLDGASTSQPSKSVYKSHRGRRAAGDDEMIRAGWMAGDRMSGTVSVDLVEEVSGIARVDVELR